VRGKTIEAIEAEKEIKAGCPFCLIDLVDQDFKNKRAGVVSSSGKEYTVWFVMCYPCRARGPVAVTPDEAVMKWEER
jgi:hypothetical protein